MLGFWCPACHQRTSCCPMRTPGLAAPPSAQEESLLTGDAGNRGTRGNGGPLPVLTSGVTSSARHIHLFSLCSRCHDRINVLHSPEHLHGRNPWKKPGCYAMAAAAASGLSPPPPVINLSLHLCKGLSGPQTPPMKHQDPSWRTYLTLLSPTEVAPVSVKGCATHPGARSCTCAVQRLPCPPPGKPSWFVLCVAKTIRAVVPKRWVTGPDCGWVAKLTS